MKRAVCISALWLLPAVLLAGCGSGKKEVRTAGDEPRTGPVDRGTPEHIADPRPEGVLYRSEVEEVRLAGAGSFMARLVIDPVLAEDGRTFVGFLVRPRSDDDPVFGAGGLQAGDVVTRVNDLPLGRPDEFMYAWEVATVASSISVDLVRGDLPMQLVFRVETAP